MFTFAEIHVKSFTSSLACKTPESQIVCIESFSLLLCFVTTTINGLLRLATSSCCNSNRCIVHNMLAGYVVPKARIIYFSILKANIAPLSYIHRRP